jgi:4-carboxymuconolactone decarboxylase
MSSATHVNKKEEKRMYLPKPFESFSKKFPHILKQHKQLGKSCRQAGPLDDKAQELVKLGIAIGVNSRGGVMSAVRKALAAGATQDEIQHAVLLATTTIGFPSMIDAMEWAKEVMENQE